MSASLFDPYDPAFRRDPYPFYARLRAEAPVLRTPMGAWVLTRYRDCATALHDARFCSSAPDAVRAVRAAMSDTSPLALLSETMLYKDAPDHTRLRRLVARPFSNRAVEDMRPRISAIVADLLDEAARSRRFDLIEALAYPLPVLVICDMLAIPTSDTRAFGEWSRDLAGVVDVVASPEVLARGSPAAGRFLDYFRELIEQRRRRPGDDLLSSLIRAEEDGETLTTSELLATCVQLLFAGHETTQNLIGNGMLALLRHPAELARLRAEPALVAGAVEELLRYDAPGQLAGRWVASDVELGGVALAAGERVTVVLASANRDEEVYTEPDRVDVGRREAPHLTFGHGPHFCLGGPLARVEAQEAIAALVARFPGMRLDGGEPPLRDTYVLRGRRELTVSV